MEQGYPTREQAQAMVNCDAFTDCKKCPADPVCLMHTKTGTTGTVLLAMHTDIECEKTRSAVYFSAGQALEKQLAEARDLVRRMAEYIWTSHTTVNRDYRDKLIAEAKAMTKDDERQENEAIANGVEAARKQGAYRNFDLNAYRDALEKRQSSETVTSAAVTLGECQAEWMADPD